MSSNLTKPSAFQIEKGPITNSRPFIFGVSAKEPAPLSLIKGHFASKIVGAEDETRRDSVQDRSRRFLDTN